MTIQWKGLFGLCAALVAFGPTAACSKKKDSSKAEKAPAGMRPAARPAVPATPPDMRPAAMPADMQPAAMPADMQPAAMPATPATPPDMRAAPPADMKPQARPTAMRPAARPTAMRPAARPVDMRPAARPEPRPVAMRPPPPPPRRRAAPRRPGSHKRPAFKKCLRCHGKSKKLPANHRGRSQSSCKACHR